MKVSSRLIIGIGIVAGLLVLASGIAMLYWRVNAVDYQIRERMLFQVVELAESIDPEDVKNLDFTEGDVQRPHYQHIRKQMVAFGLNIYQRGIYSMALKGDQIVFGPENYPDGDPMGAGPPGTIYENPTSKDFEIFRTGIPHLEGPVKDEYGEFISSLAPVIDPVSGQVLMVVGIDILANEWMWALVKAGLLPAVSTIFVLFLIITGIFLVLRRQKMKPELQYKFRHVETVIIFFMGILVTIFSTMISYESVTNERKHIYLNKADHQIRKLQYRSKFINHTVNDISRFAGHLVHHQNIPSDSDLRIHTEIEGMVGFFYYKPSCDKGSFEWIGKDSGLFPDISLQLHQNNELKKAINNVLLSRYPASLVSAFKEKDEKEHQVMLFINPINPYDSGRNPIFFKDSAAILVTVINLDTLLFHHEPEYVTESKFLNSRFIDLSVEKPSIGSEIASVTSLKRFCPLFPGKSLLAIEILPTNEFFSILPNQKFILTAIISFLTTILMTFFVRHIRNLEYNLKEIIAEQTAEIRGQLVALTEAKTQIEKSDQLKTAFLNNISHEVRTPLNGILGFSLMLGGESLSHREKEECLNMLQISSDRLTSTINNYMDMAMLITGNMPVRAQRVNPDQLILNASEKYRTLCIRKNIDFQILTDENNDDVQFYTDPDLLEKSLSHLLDNAVKFTNSGRVTIGFLYQVDRIDFFVRDTGIGISKDAQNLIFNPFTQEDIRQKNAYGGNGLGLSIAMESVSLLKGRITLQSEKGMGSAFTVSIPFKTDQFNKPEG